MSVIYSNAQAQPPGPVCTAATPTEVSLQQKLVTQVFRQQPFIDEQLPCTPQSQLLLFQKAHAQTPPPPSSVMPPPPPVPPRLHFGIIPALERTQSEMRPCINVPSLSQRTVSESMLVQAPRNSNIATSIEALVDCPTARFSMYKTSFWTYIEGLKRLLDRSDCFDKLSASSALAILIQFMRYYAADNTVFADGFANSNKQLFVLFERLHRNTQYSILRLLRSGFDKLARFAEVQFSGDEKQKLIAILADEVSQNIAQEDIGYGTADIVACGAAVRDARISAKARDTIIRLIRFSQSVDNIPYQCSNIVPVQIIASASRSN